MQFKDTVKKGIMSWQNDINVDLSDEGCVHTGLKVIPVLNLDPLSA